MNITEKEILERPNDYELGSYVRNRLYEEQLNELDVCVLCGKKSPYKRTTHIDERIGYVEGVGQGCFQPKSCNVVY